MKMVNILRDGGVVLIQQLEFQFYTFSTCRTYSMLPVCHVSLTQSVHDTIVRNVSLPAIPSPNNESLVCGVRPSDLCSTHRNADTRLRWVSLGAHYRPGVQRMGCRVRVRVLGF